MCSSDLLAIIAIPLSNLIIKSADPFKPSDKKIDSSSLENYYEQSINWQDCYGGFKCATYKVPRDYNNLDLGEFDIAVMKHQTESALGNLVVNPGGPGGSGVDYAYSYESALTKAVYESFNIVGFDPRGVGRSSAIDCLTNAETDAAYASSSYPENEADLAQMQAENQNFAMKCKSNNEALQFYSTANAARDMDILRELLGDKELNFLGKSYGTYLGTLYAKFFPDKVGRFVLDGAVDPTLDRKSTRLNSSH